MRHQCAERIGVTNGWQYAKSGSQVGRCGHLLVWPISFHALKSAEMADLVLEYDNYYGQQCAEAIGARLNYPAFMNIISNPVRMPHRDRTSHWITSILPNIMWYLYTAKSPHLGNLLKRKKHLICDWKLFTIIRGHLFSTQLILRHIPVIFYSSINNFIRFCLFCLSFI